MKGLVRLILLPLSLTVTLGVLLLRLACQLLAFFLGPLAMITGLLGLSVILFLGNIGGGLALLILAFVMGPLGAPLVLALMVELINLMNDRLRAV
jgi:hypothetical protein